MIDKAEILDFVREFGLAANVIEKDYVLGWVLAGIFNNPVIGSSWVFKGGTCLKKCFFETYRFSEDLDFTLSESNHLDQEFLVSCFKEIAQWVYNESGIEIPQGLTDDDIVRGKIDSDRDDPDYERRPLLVIDGKEISWGEFGRMLITYEGFSFKLEIFDSSDEML